MAEHWCPMCGVHHGGEAEAEAVAEVAAVDEISHAEVEIARINADKEIKLARIQAGMFDAERETELAHAEGKAEGVTETLETLAPDPEPAPVIVDAPPVEPEPIAEPLAPPPVSDGSPSPESARPKHSSHGMSSAWFG